MSSPDKAVGPQYAVKPKGEHKATIIWLHGLGDTGAYWSSFLDKLPGLFNELPLLQNIKWICPTAPVIPVTLFGGRPSTAWFNLQELSENGTKDFESLNGSADYIASLLDKEPPNIKLGVGGFSLGAATSLHFAICFTRGRFHKEAPAPAKPRFPATAFSVVVGLSSWLPYSIYFLPRNTNENIGKKKATGPIEFYTTRGASLPIQLYHGKKDDVVPYKYGEKCKNMLRSHGFGGAEFKSYPKLGHDNITKAMGEICECLCLKLFLEETERDAPPSNSTTSAVGKNLRSVADCLSHPFRSRTGSEASISRSKYTSPLSRIG